MGDNNNLNQNHNNDNDDTEERFCSICHRSEKDTGTLVDIPGGLHLCPDCMQKMINTASSIDYDSLMDQLRTRTRTRHRKRRRRPLPGRPPEMAIRIRAMRRMTRRKRRAIRM